MRSLRATLTDVSHHRATMRRVHRAEPGILPAFRQNAEDTRKWGRRAGTRWLGDRDCAEGCGCGEGRVAARTLGFRTRSGSAGGCRKRKAGRGAAIFSRESVFDLERHNAVPRFREVGLRCRSDPAFVAPFAFGYFLGRALEARSFLARPDGATARSRSPLVARVLDFLARSGSDETNGPVFSALSPYRLSCLSAARGGRRMLS